MNILRIYLGYLDQSFDDLYIVSLNPKSVVEKLKEKLKSEWEYAYVDIWENEINNIERVSLDIFIGKYLE